VFDVLLVTRARASEVARKRTKAGEHEGSKGDRGERLVARWLGQRRRLQQQGMPSAM
jgi:hypothetical protein